MKLRTMLVLKFSAEPTVTIYRNSTYVRDLIQLGFAPGYMSESTHINTFEQNEKNNKNSTTGGGLGVKASLPIVVGGGLTLGHERGNQQELNQVLLRLRKQNIYILND